MGRKIFRSGNSTVVSIPLEALEILDLDAGDQVNIVADSDRRRIIITPLDAQLSESEPELEKVPEIRDRLDRFIERYGPALERLTEENSAQESEKTGLNADALERACQLRQEFAAHHGDMPVDFVAAARSERVAQVNEVLGWSEDEKYEADES